MFLKALTIVGIVALPAACSSDQQQTEEPVAFGEDSEESTFADPASSDDSFDSDLSNAGSGDQLGAVPEDDNMVPFAGGDVPTDDSSGAGYGNTPGNTDIVADGSNPVWVRCNVLRIRKGPSAQSETQGFLTYNAEVFPTSVEGNWAKIGQNQYLRIEYLSPSRNLKPHIPESRRFAH